MDGKKSISDSPAVRVPVAQKRVILSMGGIGGGGPAWRSGSKRTQFQSSSLIWTPTRSELMPSFSAQSSSARIQESGVDALRGRFGHAIDRVGLLSAHSDFDNPRIVFDQFADGLAPKTPQLSKFANSVMLFEGGAIKRHRKGLYYIREWRRHFGTIIFSLMMSR
jgi:hypothetical protein